MTKLYCLPLPWREPIDALTALGEETGVLGFIGGGTHPMARWSCIMDQPVMVHVWQDGDATHPFDGLQATLDAAALKAEPGLGPFQGGWAGLLSYELGRAFEVLPDLPDRPRSKTTDVNWPDLWLGLYDTLAVFDAHKKRCFVLSWGLGSDLVQEGGLAAEKAAALAQRLEIQYERASTGVGPGLKPLKTRAACETAIEKAICYIQSGDIFQANISASFGGQLAHQDTPSALFKRLVTRHPSPFATFLSLGDKTVVSHSPERFVSRTPQGQLETRPIKGTAPRNSKPELDQANAQALRDSIKDRAENLMIVDLMRNDLARVCLPGSVKVPRLCALESFSTVHHLVSDVIGQQKPRLGFFDALSASFPPGSITGAPKVRAMEIITELEGERRGPWCGSMIRVGFDGRADSNVLIRTAACALINAQWHVTARAGAGIVADSIASLEYDEMLMKVRALRVAVRNAPSGAI